MFRTQSDLWSHYLKSTVLVEFDVKCSSDFYLRPLANPKSPIWYSCQLLGKESLSKIIKNVCLHAGINGRRSNHSLRATLATRLYQKGVEEQQIKDITRHHSIVVRNYKRTSAEQNLAISNLVYGNQEKNRAQLSNHPMNQKQVSRKREMLWLTSCQLLSGLFLRRSL